MNKKVLLFTMLMAVATAGQAKVCLPHLVSDNMVIQQQTDVRLWGWAKAGRKVTATTSWSNQKAQAKAQHFWRPGGAYWDECIVVKSDEVKEPVAVRYCFRNWQLGNLANQGGLPLFPFRTDNWE